MTEPPTDALGELVTGDSVQLARQIPDESVDVVCTDPPYGLADAWLYAWLSVEAARVLTPGGYLICIVSSLWTDVHLAALGLSPSLRYFATLAISNAQGSPTIWGRNLIASFKPLAVLSKGPPNPTTMRVFSMVRSGGSKKAKRWHKWGQGLGPFLVWLEAFCPHGGLVLDPFAGGGTTLVAAKTLGRRYLGFEIDPEAADRARIRLAETQTQARLWGPDDRQLQLDRNEGNPAG